MRGGLRSSFSPVTTAVFVAVLAAPALDRCVRSDVVRSTLHENRLPAPMPELPARLGDAARFAGRFQRHFDDHLGLRDQLLRWRNYGMLMALRSPVSRGFVPGEDGWLFFLGEDVLPDHRGLRRIGDAERARWIDALRERARWLAARGARYVHVVAPDKESIYPERMQRPFDAFGPTRLDQLVEIFRGVPEVEFLDLRPALIAAKADDDELGPVYHPRGTHWTARGAWIAAREIARVMQRDFPALSIPGAEDFVLAPLAGHARDDAADTHYMRGLLVDESTDYVPRERRVPALPIANSNEQDRITTVDEPGLPRVLLVHDSFGPHLQPHLSEFCARLRCVWTYSIPEAAVLQEDPDVVLACYVERALVDVPSLDVRLPMLLSLAEFRALDRGVYELDLARTDLRAEHGLRARPVEAPKPAGIEMVVESGSACFVLPRLDVPEGSRTAVRFHIDCTRSGTLGVFFTTRSSPAYSRLQARLVSLVAGSNDVCIEIPAADFDGGLKFRPPEGDAPTILRGLEVRCSPR